MERKIIIESVSNGFILTKGVHLPNEMVCYGQDHLVFETFESMAGWLKMNLGSPDKPGSPSAPMRDAIDECAEKFSRREISP